jgi:hypothetical protein
MLPMVHRLMLLLVMTGGVVFTSWLVSHIGSSQ